MSNRYDPILPVSRIADLLIEVRHVSERDKVRRHSHDDYGLGAGWVHLSVPKSAEFLGLTASQHGANGWETNYAKVRPEVLEKIGQYCLMPISGLEVLRNVTTGEFRLIATGGHFIGGCTVAVLKPEHPVTYPVLEPPSERSQQYRVWWGPEEPACDDYDTWDEAVAAIAEFHRIQAQEVL